MKAKVTIMLGLVSLLLLAMATGVPAQDETGKAQAEPTPEPLGEDLELDLDDIELDLDNLDITIEDGEINLGSTDVEGSAVEVVMAPPMAVATVIDAGEIAMSGAASVDELLSTLTGFSVNDTFAGSEVTYQGLPGKFTTVLIDGQRVPGHIMERTDLGQLPVANIERVEIIRGPQAAAYGSNNAGVVVNVVTTAPAGTGGSLTVGAGSFGYNREHLVLNGGTPEDSWMLALERKLRESYDLEPTYPDTSGDGYRQYDLFGKYRSRRGWGVFSLQSGWYREDGRGQSYSPPDQIRSNEALTRRFSLGTNAEIRLDGRSQLILDANYGTYFHDYYRYWVGFEDETAIRTNFRDELLDLSISYRQYGRDYLVTAGAGRSWDSLKSDRIEGEGSEDSEQLSGFASAELYTGDWTLTGAVRVEHNDDYGTEVSPKASVSYGISQESTLTASAGHGYRAPSLKERYYEFASPYGYAVLGNEELQPETSTSYHLDYRWQRPHSRFDLGLFRHEVDDLIVFSEIQANPQVFQTENVGEAVSSGATLSAEHEWGVGLKCLACEECSAPCKGNADAVHKMEPRGYFGLGCDITWITDSEDLALNTELPNSPEWDQCYRVFYRQSGLTGEASVKTTGARYLDRENTVSAPAYTVCDLALTRDLGPGSIRFAALNILDEKDGRYGPEPGREFRLEYTLEF